MADTALRRRIAPSTPLTLELEDDIGGKITKTFRLCFDFNAAAEIKERTDLSLLNGSIWQHIDNPTVFSVMFYAAILANHPEYRTVDDEGAPTDEGLEVIRSYMQESNADVITEALWKAYLAYLPKEKRDLMERLRAKAEAKNPDPLPQAAAPTTPESSNSLTSGPSLDTTSGSAMKSSAA
jgi:hypothetical protein